MCKWTNRKVDFDELNVLDRLAHHIDSYQTGADRYIFSRSGFTIKLVEHAKTDVHLHLITPADIYSSSIE